MIDMKISTLEAIKRLSGRGRTEKARPYDGSAELIVNRLEQYKEKTNPVIEYYKNQEKYFSIRAEGSEKEVFENLEKKVEDILHDSY